MSYILAISGPHISVVDVTPPPGVAEGGTSPGGQTFAQAYARAKLLAGWPAAPNVEEVGTTELADLLRHVGIAR